MNAALKGFAIFVFLLLSTAAIAEFGTFTTLESGGFGETFTSLDSLSFPETFTSLPSSFPDTFTALSGDFQETFNSQPPTPSGDGFGDSFGNGFDFIPFPITPDFPFTQDIPARWNSLSDQNISQGTTDNTVVYPGIVNQCEDPDGPELVTLVSTHRNYQLFLDGANLKITRLPIRYVGTEQVTLSCNGAEANFALTVQGFATLPQQIIPSAEDNLEVHIGTIVLPEQTEAGAVVPVIISFRNTGDDKLENVHVRVTLPDLGVISPSAGPFDLSQGKRTTQTLLLELPFEVQTGTYAARVTIDSASLHRVVHRDLVVE